MPKKRRKHYGAKPRPVYEDVLLGVFQEALAGVDDQLAELSDEEYQARLSSVLKSAMDNWASGQLEIMDARAGRILKKDHRGRRQFEKRLDAIWGEGLDRLELLIRAYWEFGAKFFSDGFLIPKELHDPTFRALSELHARTCRVSREILCLLRAGFADGVNARWRTLHEINVVANILAAEDSEVARRYLLHEIVMTHRAAGTYREHCLALHMKPLEPEYLAELARRSSEIVSQFGKGFATDYGWAGGLIGKAKPTFRDLRQRAGFAKWTSWHGLASETLHGGVRGLKPFGLPDHGRRFLLAGATNAAIADPGQITAISLCQTAAALMRYRPSLDNQLAVQTLRLLQERCVESLFAAHVELERREAAIRRPETPATPPPFFREPR